MDGTVVSPGLARHVPRVVLDWIADEPERLWRRVEGTMVFADISGFTALSERLATRGRVGTEELIGTLSRVFSGMLDITVSHGGQLLKFGGDALLLLFTGEDHARHAASAAVEMRSDLRRSAQIPTSVGKLNLSISMGAHSGVFDLFLVGDPYRQLMVLGSDTTAAMEAESAAEAGQVVVTAATAELLGPRSVTPRDDGQLMVRWRKAMVPPLDKVPRRSTDDEAARRATPPIMVPVLDRGVPDPLHRVATIAFFKFKGTDRILEEEGPDVLAEALHTTLTVAEAAFDAEDIALLCVDVDANGGKFFCSSGVPLTSEDDEGRMLRAARAIISAQTPLPLYVGINRGHVFASELGAREQAMFSAMGDTVNTAARIMVTAGSGTIHAHPAVLENARVRYDSTPMGPYTFKGKSQPQVVYLVGDELGPRTVADRDGLALVGREAELAELRAYLDAVTEGRGGVVTITGAAGLGKSRLIREALDQADQVSTLKISAEPYGANTSYRMVRDPLRHIFGLAQSPASEMATELRATVQRLAPHLEPFLALVGDVLQLDVEPSPEVESIAPRFRADRTADVMVELIDALHEGPMVIEAEDMHWADEASAHLLGRIAEATRTRPWLLISARRDDQGGFATELGAALTLGPLPDDQVRLLTIAASEAAPLRPHEIELVVSRAAGSPLFVGELIAAAQELGSLEAVPASLQGTLAAQVDALDPLARRVLNYASVLGRSVRRVVVEEVLRHEGLELDSAALTQLGRFIEADGPLRYRFKNGLVRDVVYDGLAYRLRSRLHLVAGEAFEKLSTDVASDAAILSLHFWHAGEHERTYRYASLAAERAERAFSSSEAAVHYERAVEAARRLSEVGDAERRRLWLALGDARRQAGLLDGALDAYRRAAALCGEDAVARAELHLRRARVRELAGSYAQALTEASRARSVAAALPGTAGKAVQARAMASTAMVRQRQERVDLARQAAESAAALAEDCGEDSALARSYNVISWAGLVSGGDDAAVYARRALELYQSLGDLAGQADMANNLGALSYFEGRWDETLEHYERSVDAGRLEGNVLDAATTEANIGEVLVSQGRLDEAEPLLRGAARALRASGIVSAAAFAETHLGRLLCARGDYVAAERVLRSVVEELRSMGRGASAYETGLHLAECLVLSGRFDDGLAVIAESAADASGDESFLDALRCVVSAQALLGLGFVDEAIETIVAGVEAARDRSLDYDLARLLLVADRIGEPFDSRLGTTKPAEEANRILDRLGSVMNVSA